MAYLLVQFHRCLRLVSTVVASSAAIACAHFPDSDRANEQVAYHVFNDTAAQRIILPELFNGDFDSSRSRGLFSGPADDQVAFDQNRKLYANLQSTWAGAQRNRSGSWVWGEQGVSASDEPVSYASYDSFGRRLPGALLPDSFFERVPSDEALLLPRPMAGAFQSAPLGHRIPREVLLQWREPAKAGQGLYKGRLVGPMRLVLRPTIPPAVLRKLASSWRNRLEIAIAAVTEAPRVLWRLTQVSDQGLQVLAQGAFTAIVLRSGVAAARAQAE